MHLINKDLVVTCYIDYDFWETYCGINSAALSRDILRSTLYIARIPPEAKLNKLWRRGY